MLYACFVEHRSRNHEYINKRPSVNKRRKVNGEKGQKGRGRTERTEKEVRMEERSK